MTTSSQTSASKYTLFVSALLVLCGLPLLVGGGWLAAAGGSWYYLLAGIGMLISAFLLARQSRAGVWMYGLVVLGTVVWSAWESGLDYWRWVPRLDVVMVLALLVALTMPRLKQPFSKTLSYTYAGASVAIFVVAFALAFVPYGFNQYDAVPATAKTSFSTYTGQLDKADQPASGDWPAYGRDNAATRYSPLTQINTDNVSGLTRAWEFRTGEMDVKSWGAETTPIKVNDRLYLCSGLNNMFALDSKTGKQIWKYDAGLDQKDIPYTAACRGVAYYETPASAMAEGQTTCKARIVEGTLDGRIIEVDADTGKPCEDFGDHGQVSIKEHMGETPDGYVAITGVPNIVQGVIITGHQVIDGQARYEPSGVIKAYDAVTGELKWAWDMVRPDIDTIPPEGETYTRGTPNMWTTGTSDNELGLVYLPMGNSTADYYSSMRRKEEHEYSSSLVAIDVNTGKPVWHFQTVHADVWDYDLGSQVTLLDFPVENGTVPALMLPSKQGDLYVLDRRTGKPLTGVTEKPVAQGGVEPEERSATQPVSEYHALRKPPLTAQDMWGITPFDQLACRIQFQEAAYDGMYTPPTVNQRWIQYPSYNGGSDWGSVAIDPERGVMIANYNDMPMYNKLVPRDIVDKEGWLTRAEENEKFGGPAGGAEGAGDPQVGTPYGIDVNAGWRLPFTGLLCKEPPYGGIRAIDIATGKTLWDRPLGTARNNGPFGIASHLPINIGTPNNGGAVVTAGDLIFIAAATDGLIRAIDINTGDTVWQDELPTSAQANPMVYEQDGKEYLVIMAGGHHFMETPVGDYVIAYALPDNIARNTSGAGGTSGQL